MINGKDEDRQPLVLLFLIDWGTVDCRHASYACADNASSSKSLFQLQSCARSLHPCWGKLITFPVANEWEPLHVKYNVLPVTMSSALFFSSRSAIQIPGWGCVWHQHWTDLGTCLWEGRNHKLWTSLLGGQFWHPGKSFLHFDVESLSVILHHSQSDWLVTYVSINRWRRHLDPQLPMLWKV